jgi:hypothetical protein
MKTVFLTETSRTKFVFPKKKVFLFQNGAKALRIMALRLTIIHATELRPSGKVVVVGIGLPLAKDTL